MICDHAIIEKDGYKVPLIGIPPASVLETYDLCRDIFPLREIELQQNGQQLCKRCAGINANNPDAP